MARLTAVSALLMVMVVSPGITQAQAPKYTVSLGGMEVYDGVSAHIEAQDVDYATVSATLRNC
jgi:hypothetical protein